MINVLKYVQELEQAGMTSEQAKIISKAQVDMLNDSVVTKADFMIFQEKVSAEFQDVRNEMRSEFRDVRNEMRSEFKEVRGEIRELRTEMKLLQNQTILKLGSLMVVLAGLMTTLTKLL